MDADSVIAATDQMISDRRPFEAEWTEIRQWLLPASAPFQGEEVGFPNRDRIVDSSGEMALDALSAGIVASVFNPATKWLEQRLVDVDDPSWEERVQLEHETAVMLGVLGDPVTRFNVAAHMAVREFCAFGTGCLFVADRPDHPTRLPLFQAVPLAEIAVGEDEDDTPSRLVRRFRLTARQAATEYGVEALPKTIREALSSEATAGNRFWFRHYVARRRDRDPTSDHARNMPIGSWTVAEVDKTLVRESGFQEMPYLVFRWLHVPGRPYGRGPGGKALPEIRMNNTLRKLTIEGAEKSLNPPLLVASDGVIGDPDMRSAGISYVEADFILSGRDPIKPLLTATQPLLGVEFHDWIRRGIDEGFMKPLMQLERDPKMTATQALILEEEQLRGLAPLVAHLETELLGGLHARVRGILKRRRMLPPAGPGMEGREVRASFVSPSARAQKLSEVRGFSQRNDIMMPFLQAGAFDPGDGVDMLRSWRYLGETLGVPAHLDVPYDEGLRRAAQREAGRAQAVEIDQSATLMASAGKGANVLEALKGPDGSFEVPGAGGAAGPGGGADIDQAAPMPDEVGALMAELGGG